MGSRVRIRDIVEVAKHGVTPQAGSTYHHYSLLAFDNGRKPEVAVGADIRSGKLAVQSNLILMNKLNVRFKRVWPVLQCGDNSIASTEFIPLKPSNVDYWFLYYLLVSPGLTMKLAGMRTGTSSSHQRIDVNAFLDMEVSLPDGDEQQKIGSLLRSLDSKIELNQRTNDYLAELIRVEFAYRFGPESSTTNLSNVMSISTRSLKPSACLGETWEHYSIPAFDENRRPVFELADGIKSNKYIIDNDCILISKLNPSTKRLWLPFCTSERSVCSTEFIVYKPKKPEHKSFYYAAIDSPAFTDFLLAHVTGSTGSRQRTQPGATLRYPMPNPDSEDIEGFCEFADPIIAKWQLNERESARLEHLRNMLLPKLMSGEIDVSHVELPEQFVVRAGTL